MGMARVDLAQAFLVGSNLFQGTLIIHVHLGLIFSQTQGANSSQAPALPGQDGFLQQRFTDSSAVLGSRPQQCAVYTSAPHS